MGDNRGEKKELNGTYHKKKFLNFCECTLRMYFVLNEYIIKANNTSYGFSSGTCWLILFTGHYGTVRASPYRTEGLNLKW